jgi:hypothetical protein
MTLASFVPDQHIRLRSAMDGKASKYGELGRPLLLVLGSTQFQSDRDLMTALLGDVQWHINFATKAVTTGRRPNGVLYDAKGPRNVAMSAVMHGHMDALSFAAKDRPMALTHHPFAAYVLERGLFPFCEERYFDAATGELVTVPPGISVQEFFGLEAGWPHFDRDGR